MFEDKTRANRSPLLWLALGASITLHLVLALGLNGVQLPLPGPHGIPAGDATPSVAVQVEAVDEVVLDS